jgi:hypothetical protein
MQIYEAAGQIFREIDLSEDACMCYREIVRLADFIAEENPAVYLYKLMKS